MIEPIGRGGMAEVWRAVHVGQQLPVAFKVITRAAARNPLFRRVLKNEVQSVARLDHPGIIMMLDHGEITPEAAIESDGALTAGSPYLAMELASWGSLDRLDRTLEWSDLCRILLGLLDALAHAHARGVLHRDLKPGNILVSTAEDLRPGIKLTDFGIAHALEPPDETKERPLTGGTPLFMAPEQFIGDWRAFGPWTDLYAVGCLAFFFATGRPPFSGDTTTALGVQHIRNPPPALLPFHPMPIGFEGWVLRLLAKEPAERYQRAADAAWALARLRDDQPIGPSREPSSVSMPEGYAVATTLPWMVDEKLLENVTPPGQVLDPPRRVALIKREIPPLPFSWRTPPRAPPPPKLIGASLALYGIRRVPLVDREKERDLLWSRLSRVRDSEKPEVVVLQGPAGTGKSRVAEWFCERADEVGGAIVLKALFGPMRSPSEAIGAMFDRYLRTTGLDQSALCSRVERMLRQQGVTDSYEWRALAELIARRPAEAETQASFVRFTTAAERHNLVQRFLARLAKERPVVVWFDDVQWGADALIYARHLLDGREEDPCRVLMVMTVRDDVVVSRPMEAELLEELKDKPGTTSCAIGPLPPDHQQTLIHELLGLRQDLAAKIATRTAGNPLFAVQLVDDWVHRGVVELDDSGFRLKEGEEAELPADLRAVWLQRIDDLLEGEPAESIVALELAAILGGEVVIGEWESACARYGITIPPNLLTAMTDHHLVYSAGNDRFTFAHNMLRESLEEHARDRRRYAAHHRLCAETLSARHAKPIGTAERIGRHFLEGGRHADALVPLYWAAMERWNASDYTRAQLLLTDYERTLAAIATDNADPRWGDCWVLRARIANMQGRHKDAITWSERARDHARYFGLKAPLANALRERASVAHVLGDTDYARRLLAEAEELLREVEDAQGLSLCQLATADVLLSSGDLDQAQERYETAARALENDGDWIGLAQALDGLGSVAVARRDRAGATSIFENALRMTERTGNRHGFARAKAALANLERDRGNLAPAERDLRDAIRILEAIGSQDAVSVRTDLALLLLEAGDYAQARRELQPMRSLVDLAAEPLELCRVRTALAADAAAHEQWPEVRHHLAEVQMTLQATAILHVRIAAAAQLVAEIARRHGQSEVAELALRIARAQQPATAERRPDRGPGDR